MATERNSPERWALPSRLLGPSPERPVSIAPVHATATEQPVFDATNPRQRAVLEKLEQGTEAILGSEGFTSYLKTLSKFHHYSFNNVILIMNQMPTATLVNAYDRWQELGRQVKKGEKGIKIFYPAFGTRLERDPDTGEERDVRYVRSFGIGNVFDVSQTDGEALPEAPGVTEDTTVDDASTALNLKLSRYLIDEGVRLESVLMEGHARGLWDPVRNRIAIKASTVTSPFSVSRTGTLAHELAHREAGHRGNVDRQDAEAVAEGVSYVVLDHFSLDSGQKSFAYIAGWAKDRAVLRRNLGEIQKVSHRIITAVEGVGDPYADDFGSFDTADPWAAVRDQLADEGYADRTFVDHPGDRLV